MVACAFGVAIDQVFVFHLLPLHCLQYIAHYRATKLPTRLQRWHPKTPEPLSSNGASQATFSCNIIAIIIVSFSNKLLGQ